MRYHEWVTYLGVADIFLKRFQGTVVAFLKAAKPPDLQGAIQGIIALDKLQEGAKVAKRPISAQMRATLQQVWKTASGAIRTATGILQLKGEKVAQHIPKRPLSESWTAKLDYLIQVGEFLQQHPEVPVVNRKDFEQDIQTLRELRKGFGDAHRMQKAITGKLDGELRGHVEQGVAWVELYRWVGRITGNQDILLEMPRVARRRKSGESPEPSPSAAA